MDSDWERDPEELEDYREQVARGSMLKSAFGGATGGGLIVGALLGWPFGQPGTGAAAGSAVGFVAWGVIVYRADRQRQADELARVRALDGSDDC